MSTTASHRRRLTFGQAVRELGLRDDMSLSHAYRLLTDYGDFDRDPLTGLANQQQLSRVMPRLVAESQTLTTMFCDINGLKGINSDLGHANGSEALRQYADRLRSQQIESAFFCRKHGDEFVIVIPDLVDADHAHSVALELCVALTGNYLIRDQRERRRKMLAIEIGPSIGYYFSPRPAADVRRRARQTNVPEMVLVDMANEAMMDVKYSPDARQVEYRVGHYSERLQEEKRKRRQYDERLARAIKERRYGFYYQPIIELATGRIIGAESLFRPNWVSRRDLERDIARAEELGCMGMVVEPAIVSAVSAFAHVPGFQMFINLPLGQVLEDEVVAVAQKATARYDVEPQRLTFEMIERGAVGDQGAGDLITQLQRAGFGRALDDFGVAESSLDRLYRLRSFTHIKIPAQFIQNMVDDTIACAIVKTIITLAHEVDMLVIAEGIEDTAHLRLCEEMGCDFGQGFFLGRPETADRLLKRL